MSKTNSVKPQVCSDLTLYPYGVGLQILPGFGLFLLDEKKLLVSDLHWGKDAVSRNLGCPISPQSLQDDLDRLKELVNLTKAKSICVLGDLIDGKSGMTQATLDLVQKFRREVPTPISLILGNHDEQLEQIPSSWAVEVFEKPQFCCNNQVLLSHEPVATSDFPNSKCINIHGHVHPVVLLKDKSQLPLTKSKRTYRKSIRLKCCYFTETHFCLPAFSGLAGGYKVESSASQAVVGMTDKLLIHMIGNRFQKWLRPTVNKTTITGDSYVSR